MLNIISKAKEKFDNLSGDEKLLSLIVGALGSVAVVSLVGSFVSKSEDDIDDFIDISEEVYSNDDLICEEINIKRYYKK